jgi:hypothetical protein
MVACSPLGIELATATLGMVGFIAVTAAALDMIFSGVFSSDGGGVGSGDGFRSCLAGLGMTE